MTLKEIGLISIGTDSITDETRSDALDVLRSFSTLIPRAAAPRRLALTVATGMLVLLSSVCSHHNNERIARG